MLREDEVALSGSLADVSVAGLVGLLTAGDLSGELVVAGHDGLATLQLCVGRLVGATAGELVGLEAVQALVSWSEGEFELRRRGNELPPAADLTLHDAAFRFLSDPSNAPRRELLATPPALDPDRCAVLAGFLSEHAFARFACTFDRECAMNAEAAAGTLAPREMSHVATCVCSFLQGHPRGTARRVVLEDDQGIVVGARMPSGGVLVLMGDSSATTGAVAAATTRLLGRLGDA